MCSQQYLCYNIFHTQTILEYILLIKFITTSRIDPTYEAIATSSVQEGPSATMNDQPDGASHSDQNVNKVSIYIQSVYTSAWRSCALSPIYGGDIGIPLCVQQNLNKYDTSPWLGFLHSIQVHNMTSLCSGLWGHRKHLVYVMCAYIRLS